MDNRDILLVILVLAFMYNTYELNKLKTTEKFTTTNTQDQINTAVKRIYLADVEAIRLLSNFAIQLSQGGTTVPGNVTFSGKISTNGLDPNDMPTNWGGGLRTHDLYSTATIAAGDGNPGTRTVNSYMNKNGDIYAKAKIECDGTITGSTITGSTIKANDIIYSSRGLRIMQEGEGPDAISPTNPYGEVYGIFYNSKGSKTSDGLTTPTFTINNWTTTGFRHGTAGSINIWFDHTTGIINCKGLNIVP